MGGPERTSKEPNSYSEPDPIPPAHLKTNRNAFCQTQWRILLTVLFRPHDRAKGGRTEGGRTEGGRTKGGRTKGGRTRGGRT